MANDGGTRGGGADRSRRGGRVDGTNAQPGYHINLAAYKFAQDRVKPLQAAGRGRCKREERRGEKGAGRKPPLDSSPSTTLSAA